MVEGTVAIGERLFQAIQQIPLIFIQAGRNFDYHLNVLITMSGAAEMGNSLPPKAKGLSILGAGRNL